MVFHIAKVHIGYAVQELGKAFVPLCNGRTQLVAVYIKIIEQSGKAAFGRGTLCRSFDVVEHTLQGLIQIFIIVSSAIDIAEQFRWRNEKAFFFNQSLASFFCIVIGHLCIIKINITGILFSGIDIIRQIFGDISIKHCTEDIVFKIPTVHGTTQFICNSPYCTMQLVTLLFFLCINHGFLAPFYQV